MTAFYKREGFWREGKESSLPMPVARQEAWKGRGEFLKSLAKKEKRANKAKFKGDSLCRLCKKLNKSGEYSFEGWAWPEGFRHYVEKHNVRPSLAFQEFIIEKHIE